MPSDEKKPDPKPHTTAPITGRTNADAVVETIKPLGLFGLAVLLVGVFGYALYIAYKDANSAQREMYKDLGPMTEKMIQNIDQMLTVQNKVLSETEAQRSKLREQIDETRKAEDSVEAMKAEFSKRLADVEKLKKDAGDAELLLKETQGRLAKAQSNLTTDVGKLQEDLNTLLSHLESERESLMPETVSVFREIAARHTDIGAALLAVAENPTAANESRLRLAAHGKSLDNMKQIVAADTNGFDLWVQVTMREDPAKGLLAVRFKDGCIASALALRFTGDAIEEAVATGQCLLLDAPDPNNWNAVTLYTLTVVLHNDQSRPVDVRRILNHSGARETQFFMLLKAEGLTSEIVAGTDQPIIIHTLDEARRKRPDLVDKAIEAEPELMNVASMLASAAQFSGPRLMGARNATPSGTPEEAAAAILDAAVSRDQARQRQLTAGPYSPELWGQLAAAVLRPSFIIERVIPPSRNTTQPSEPPQSLVPSDDPSPGPNEAFIDARDSDSRLWRAALSRTAPGAEWKLSGYASRPIYTRATRENMMIQQSPPQSMPMAR
jgi:hypothetical protein